jgi:hypothetical protein
MTQEARADLYKKWTHLLLSELIMSGMVCIELRKVSDEYGLPPIAPEPGFIDIHDRDSGINRLVRRAIELQLIDPEDESLKEYLKEANWR